MLRLVEHAAIVALLVVATVASRPLEARLWRAGRLTDRAAAILLLSRFPAMVLAFGLISGASPPFFVATTALACLPMVFGFRFFVRLLHDEWERH